MDDSPLARLPRELRNQIYHAVLVRETPVRVDSPLNSPRLRHENHPVSLAALLQTCRQVRSEAAAMFYGLNTFVVVDGFYEERDLHLFAWLGTLGDDTKALLRHVRLEPRSATRELGWGATSLIFIVLTWMWWSWLCGNGCVRTLVERLGQETRMSRK